MLYVDNLQHGLPIEPFSLPRCAILDSPNIDKISRFDRRGDVAKGVIEYGNLRVRMLIISFFLFAIIVFHVIGCY
jgi:hypothetical protein